MLVFNFLLAFGGALVGPAAQAVTTQIIPPVVRTLGIQMLGLAAIPGIVFFLPMSGTLLQDYGYTGAILFSVPFAIAGALVNMSAASFFEFDRRNALAASMADADWRKAKAEGRGKMLVCRDVDVEYDGVQVLFGVDFDVEEGADHRPARHQRRGQVDAAAGHQRHPGGLGGRHRVRRAGHHPHAAPRDGGPGGHPHARRAGHLPRPDGARRTSCSATG